MQRDVAGVDADQNAVLADQDQVVGFVHDLDARHVAGRVVADADAAAVGDAVIVNAAAASLAVLGKGQDGRARAADAGAHHIVALTQADGTHAVAGASHGAGAVLHKADGCAVVGGNDNFVIALGQVAPDQAVALVQRNGDQTHLADVAELRQRRALDQTLTGDHGCVGVILVRVGGLAQHQGDLFALLQLQQVDDVGTLGGAAALGNLVALQPVDAALVGHKQHIIVGRTDVQLLGKVLVLLGHTLHAAPAAVLRLIGVQRRALDVALVGQRKDAGFLGDEVLDVHLAGNGFDGGAALIAVLVGKGAQVGLDDLLDVAVVGEDVLVIGDGKAQITQLLLDFQDLETCQATQLQLDDGVRLHLVKAEVVHNGLARLGKAALAGADGGDDLIDDVHRLAQTLQNMLALLRLFQIEGGAAADDLHLELNIAFHHRFQAHNLGNAVVQRQHNDTHGVLQLGVAVELVQHDLGVGVLFDLDDDLHTRAGGGFVVQVADALDALVLDKVGDALDQAGLVDHIGDLGDEDLKPPVFLFHNFGTPAQRDFAAPGRVGGADAAAPHNDAAGGEVGSLDVFHQPGKVDFGVVHQGDHTVDDLAQVVRRDVGRHTDSDALAAVDQQVGEAAGQDVGFLFGFVKVGVPVDGVLLDVGQHFARHLGHTRLGITVGSRGVAVNGAEVALTVHQRVPQAEILCQTHHGVVHGGVAVRVVRTQHGTDGIGGFAIGVLRVVAALVHGVQNTAMNGLQAVAHVRQRARHDDGHRVIQKRGFDFVLDIAHNDLGTRPGHHNNIFFHGITLVLLRGRGGARPARNRKNTAYLRVVFVQQPFCRVIVDVLPKFQIGNLIPHDPVVIGPLPYRALGVGLMGAFGNIGFVRTDNIRQIVFCMRGQ